MSTFLQLAARLRQDCGIAGTGPTTVVAQTGELARLVSWIATAYTNICAQHSNWKFLRSAFGVNTVTDQEAYLATACTDTEVGALIGSATVGAFGSWAIDNEYPWWIYRLADGTSTRNYFWNLDHASFRDRYDLRPPNHNKPFEYAIRPRDNAILLGPKPDGVYVVQGEYYRVAPPLAVDGDTPLFPERFHMAIVHLAKRYYAGYEEDGGVYMDANSEFGQIYFPLMQDQLPQLRLGGPLC